MDDRKQALRNIVATSEEAGLYHELEGLVLTESGWQADPVFLPTDMHVQFDSYGEGFEAAVFADSDPGGPVRYAYFKDLPEAAEWVRWMKDL